jgi:hypothetical protein
LDISNCHNSGHYPSLCLLPYLKYDVSETGFRLRLQAQPTQMGPIERASFYVRTQWAPLKTVTGVHSASSDSSPSSLLFAFENADPGILHGEAEDQRIRRTRAVSNVEQYTAPRNESAGSTRVNYVHGGIIHSSNACKY